MATKYCDQGAYDAYAATPTWGVPQDGDGAAKAASTSSATASIVFTGIPVGTISVCGVTVAPTFATSADVSANNLATAINAATGNVTTTGFRASAVQLRNAVYARGPSGGAPAGTCQIMTRHGSANFNGHTAIAHTLTNVNAGASSLTFSGGVSGCWGYLTNSAVVWASAVAIAGYGILSAALPYAGALSAGDVVKIRSGKTISLSGNAVYSITMAAMGTASSPVVFEFDDSTEWSDGADPVFRIIHTPGSNGYSLSLVPTNTTNANIKAKKYSNGTRNFSIELVSTTGLTGSVSLNIGGNVLYENILVRATGTRSQSQMVASIASIATSQTGNQISRFKGCKIAWPGQQANLIAMSNGGYNYRAEAVDCEFVATDAATAATSVVAIHNNNTHRLLLDSCKFTGFVSGSRLIAASTSQTGEDALFVRNCDMGNVNVLGPNLMSSAVGEFDAGMRGFFMTSQYGSRDFIYERAGRLYVEWLASKGRPTLNARLHDGVTAWSIFAVPSNTADALGPLSPSELPRIAKIIPENGDLAEGVRTLKVNFLLESNLSWTKREVSVLVEYQTPEGVVQSYDTFDMAGAALDSSSATWSATTWNSQTWVPKEFSITTPSAVKAGSEIGIYVRLHITSANETWGIILDPEVIVT